MPKYLRAGKLTPAGQELVVQLYHPAVRTMTAWLADGRADTLSRYGWLPEQVLGLAQADHYLREDIAIETFLRALPTFLRGLDAGNYDARRGTTISTYFLGACRNRIGDVIRAQDRRIAELREDPTELLHLLQSDSPGFDEVDGIDLARHLLLEAPEDLRAALLLRVYAGVTLTEAAKRLGLNPASIRSQLLRYRTKLAQLHSENKITLPEDAAIIEWAEQRQPRGKDASPEAAGRRTV